MRYYPIPTAGLLLVVGVLTVHAGQSTGMSQASKQRSEAERLDSLEKQVDALASFYRLRWPRDPVDAGYDPVDIETWENSNDSKDRLAMIRVKLELIEPRIAGLVQVESTQQGRELDRVQSRCDAIQHHITQLAESYSELIETLRGFGGINVGMPTGPVPQPATGTVEVFNYVPYFQTFRVNGQVQIVQAASIRRVFDLFGTVLSQATIPGKAVFTNVSAEEVETQLNGNLAKRFDDWTETSEGTLRMTRQIR